MTVKNPKCLVIDTSVMHAAGGENAIYPESKYCRDFLMEVMRSGHSIIMTDDLYEEWEKHKLTTKSFNPKSPAWYATMQRKGKLRRHIGNTQREELREAILQEIHVNAKEVVRKDMRLIEAALIADNIVASKDNRIRGHFSRATHKIQKLQIIIWVNPAIEEEICVIWLRESAPPDVERMLSYIS